MKYKFSMDIKFACNLNTVDFPAYHFDLKFQNEVPDGSGGFDYFKENI